MSVINKYFNGISTGNLEEILGCLDANLLVRYPEKSKGWSGIVKARKRYGNMLQRSPSIRATFVILDSDSERSFTTITATVRFQCSESKLDVVRDILYVVAVEQQKIIVIDHK
jgi:hypothetical protein